MPGIIDDIIIKKVTLAGMFEAAVHEGEQIEKRGMLADCVDLDAELHAAYVPFRDTLQKVTEEMKARIDREIGLTQP